MSSGIDEIGVGMVGYAFTDKAHSYPYLGIAAGSRAACTPLTARHHCPRPRCDDSHRGQLRLRACDCLAPHGATFKDGYRAAEVCDAILSAQANTRCTRPIDPRYQRQPKVGAPSPIRGDLGARATVHLAVPLAAQNKRVLTKAHHDQQGAIPATISRGPMETA